MKITLDNDYYILVSQWSYDLRKDTGLRETVDAKTNTIKQVNTYEEFGFFGSLEKAVGMYTRLMLIKKLAPETDLKTYIAEYKQSVDMLMQTINLGAKK